ncbi:histidine kinase [Flavobacterium sp. ALD4]|uniref:sensor histidine kinase n=1 Tax=Flavobacterium sp. ALD4 TaxID=2058314 RepID=UPI000C340EAA|nr:histidine kinase [Flavobacterium sp. ALD4]PKH67795.1 histidine kinase [Flavobacterium sp. ALD4]
MKSQNSWLFISFIFTYSLFGQYLPSKNYTTADGLPNNAVRSLFLDSKDILWIGMENGVSKMENGSFANLDESDGLGHNSCWDISQDRKGNMWFASYGGGVSKFDGEKFTVFTTKNGLASDNVRKVFSYKNKMYLGTELGVSILDINTSQIANPKDIKPHFGVFIVTDFFVHDNEVYFSTINEGLFKLDESEGVAKIVTVLEYKLTGRDTDSHAYSLGYNDTSLYSSNKGFIDVLSFDNIKNVEPSAVPFGQSIVWQYAKDKRDVIYAAAWGIFDNSGGLYQISDSKMINVSDYYGIDSQSLLNAAYDKGKDILYVGSKDKGVYEVRLDKMIEYNFFEGKTIIDFEKSGDKKIILHNKGLSILGAAQEVLKSISLSDFKSKQLNYIRKSNKRLPTHADNFFELDYRISSKGIEFYKIVKHYKSFWVSSNIGVFEINFEGEIINYIPIHTYEFGFTGNNKFFETNPYGGVHVYDDIYNLKVNSVDEKTTAIVNILNHNQKTYLLSVFNGLFVHHDNQFHSYLAEGIWKEKKLKHIVMNDRGQLILASEFGDVFVVDDTKLFKIVKVIPKDQLAGKTILFLEAYKNYIFIGTEKGINIYQNGKVRLIDKQLGLIDCVFTTSKIFENQLWLGSKEGYYIVDLTTLTKEQRTVAKLGISEIAINSIPINKSNFNWFRYASDELRLDYNQNSLSIDFMPEGHVIADKLKFRYRLKSSNRWSPYSDKANLFLAYLPYGHYLVEVEVLDLNAGKSTIFKLLKVYIAPPFWFTWWFISLILLFVMGIVFYFIIRKKNKVRYKAIVEKQITEAKFEALSNQMNPHFIYNALESIQDFVKANDEINSSLYISEFAVLMRKTLKNSPKQTISIKDEVEYLQSYIFIENMRFKDRVLCDVYIDPSVAGSLFEIPPMLIQPFVENVFAHAFDENFPSPKLNISFEMIDERFLECKIIDNGKGLNAAKKSKFHVSRGIALARERIILLQKNNLDPIHIDFTKGMGTTVTIRLFVTE